MTSPQDKKPDEDARPSEQPPPDKRGPRPTDPNALAKWIVEQTTGDDNEPRHTKPNVSPRRIMVFSLPEDL